MIDNVEHYNKLQSIKWVYTLLQADLFGFTNNILSGTKYRVSPEGVSLMDETNKLASHLERSPLIHSYGYDYYGHPALALRARLRITSCNSPVGPYFVRSNLLLANLSAGDRPTCLTSLPIKSKSLMQYAGNI